MAEVQIDKDQRKKLFSLLTYSVDLFGVTLGKRDSTTFDLEMKLVYKPYNYIYYLVPKIDKDNFCKELQRLV